MAWIASIASSRRRPVGTDCTPRIGRSRSLMGTWRRSTGLVVSLRARCKPVRVRTARRAWRRTART
jgi:hypothetical protein